jgi:hypothetical protein
MRTYHPGRASSTIWANPAYIKDYAYAVDAANIHHADDKTTCLGFHITSKAGAEAILRDGPRMSTCKVGFDAREMPTGFWVSGIPLLADGYEQWVPHLDHVEKVYLGVEFTWTGKQVVEEPTWSCLQMCLQPEHIIGIRVMPPEDLVELRSDEALRKLAEGIAEDPVETYHFKAYRDAITQWAERMTIIAEALA